jgi:hypothetical protein
MTSSQPAQAGLPSHQQIGLALTTLGALIAGGGFALVEVAHVPGFPHARGGGAATLAIGLGLVLFGVLRTIVPDVTGEAGSSLAEERRQERDFARLWRAWERTQIGPEPRRESFAASEAAVPEQRPEPVRL